MGCTDYYCSDGVCSLLLWLVANFMRILFCGVSFCRVFIFAGGVPDAFTFFLPFHCCCNKTLFLLDLLQQFTMTRTGRLPREVFLKIFGCLSNLDKRSLKNCIIVSQKWQEPATQAYYKELTLQAKQINKIKTLLGDKLPNQDDHFKQLYWIKKLKIRNDKRKGILSR